MPGLGRGPSPEDLRRRRVIVSRLTEPPASLVIVRDNARVIITDGDGRSVTYTADGRKEPRLTGDGEFTSRATFEGQVMVIKEDFGAGVTLTTRLAPTSVGGRERLEVSLKGNGLPKPPDHGGRPVETGGRPSAPPLSEVLRIYERAEH
jgi:hypothetical protein